ncbi:DUF488 domain-containing protein [Pseudodesulfovibrio thermohalotolerans]|uniref:DUF488 domain-containing protein n=1 Tax=Pseudodesulfovibrio thermohalotolerans TaxID=2880651 RepID=UPI0024416663|nr:DUF488 domain-containing protein [Pseudodesulfovibrio thermohalotolerans]WFS62302.1 DUF488 domain-containing protein [Pseudodesulfovibrio thermohalotolerans]
MGTIFTIGYTSFTDIDSFLQTLHKQKIKAVIDVRSSPYSKIHPEYNKENIKRTLNSHQIYYVFLGNECGARVDEKSCYVDGQVNFNCVSSLPKFKSGLERIYSGAKKFNVALMCAEKDPITCHRTILISKNLKQYCLPIMHLLDTEHVETHEELEQRLLKVYELNQSHFFKNQKELLEEAYEKQANKIAYRIDENDIVYEVHHD